MTFEEAKVLAKKGIKVTHRYFNDSEFMTIEDDMCIFGDGIVYNLFVFEFNDNYIYGWDIWGD